MICLLCCCVCNTRRHCNKKRKRETERRHGVRFNVLYFTVLCCAVLCCAVLCCAVLCCAVLCCAVLCCAVLCCAVLCCNGLLQPLTHFEHRFPSVTHKTLPRSRTAMAVPATIMIRATFPQASKIPHIVVVTRRRRMDDDASGEKSVGLVMRKVNTKVIICDVL
jgi:hypothetical protein